MRKSVVRSIPPSALTCATSSGHKNSGRNLRGITFAVNETKTLDLTITAPSLRTGLFQVDLAATGSAGVTRVMGLEVGETISIYGQPASIGGRVHLRGGSTTSEAWINAYSGVAYWRSTKQCGRLTTM